MEINKQALDALSDDVKAKLLACETPEDMLALAKQEGMELSDEQMDAVAGGVDWISCYAVNCCPGVHHSG